MEIAKKIEAFIFTCFFVVSLTFFMLICLTGNLAAQQKMEVAGKSYTKEQGKWFIKAMGKSYEVNSRVITVKFKRGVKSTSKMSLYSRERFTEVRTNALGYVDLEVPEGTNPLEFIQKLQEENIIDSAEVNTYGEYVASVNPNDPRFPDQWHLPKTNVAPNPTESAWDITTGSKDIVIAVLDSGTDIGHEDLIGNIWINPREDIDGDQDIVPANPDHLDNDDKNGVDDGGNLFIDDLCGWDFGNNNNDVRGPFFHGTHVAGIIGAMTDNGIGVAGVAGGLGSNKGCRVMALGVGENAPDGSVLDDAIIYAADNGARIITMSLSVASSVAINDAISYAYNQKGVFIDCAAGNNAGPVTFPATNLDVVAVSSTDKTDVISSFSNRGPEIELAAPGEEIWSTQLNNSYNQGAGTSYSAPQVAGVAGLLLSCDPSLTNKQVRSFLHSSSLDLGAPGKDDLYGFGRINALAALKAAGCGEEELSHKYEYTAKIVCGIQKDPKDMRLARGFYATTINIHNPNKKAVKFFKKLALTFPPKKQKPGKIMPIGKDILKTDQALKVDCENIQRELFPNGFPTPYIEGFVVIQSPASLDVTAVYTTAALDKEGRVTDHSSIDVEQIRERKFKRKKPPVKLPDLIPVPDQNGFFCKLRDGKLVVTVKNQGTGPSGPSTTEVDFFSHGMSSKPVPPLDPKGGPNDSIDLIFNIPTGCFDSDCEFRITVDVMGEVSETDESNNIGSGSCIG